MTTVDLSIIVVNWNTREYLAKCLRSLESSELPVASREPAAASAEPVEGNGPAGPMSTSLDGVGSQGATHRPLSVEVIVVDNASSDGSAAMVRERFPWVRLIANTENAGFARANNQAIRQSNGRYVGLLNSDTEIYPGAFKTMVTFMEEHPRAAGCGPRLLNADSTLQPSCHPVLTPDREFWRLMFLDRIWRRATYDQERWDKATARQTEVIKGACLLLRRTALAEVGLLDERYFVYTEEMDLCHRMLQAGWELWWVPGAVVKHYGEASSSQISEDMYVQLYLSKVQFHRKFGGERQATHFKQLMRVAYAPRLWVMRALRVGFPGLGARAGTYARLLHELPKM
jgi:GT2 family glycosyltransferase